MPPPKVYLLGAGPGDPELITVRALRRLREADLVLYDALAHPDLLRHTKPGAELVFVGKRAGAPSARQDAIHARMRDAIAAGKTVARLKGGDPYLFGRGSEEAEFLAAEGIPFEVVPGVPSPMAATAYAGLSLTHRALSSSVAYVTATESPEKDASAHDWDKLATATQTLVFFMGMRRLDALMALLVAHGRPASTPAAVVHWASTPQQRTVVGTVGDIAAKAAQAGLGLPSLTIVGDVVTLREHLRWYDRLPLFGQRVLVTRAAGQAESFVQRLRDLGADPLTLPSIRIAPPRDPGPLAQAVRDAGRYDWVVFTSRNGVDAFFRALHDDGGDARRLGQARLAAIGPATADALLERHLRADLVPEEYRGEAAADALIAFGISGARVLVPRARVAREVLPERLHAAGAFVDVVEAYETLAPEASERAALREATRTADIVTFTSSSTVENLVEALGDDAPALLARTTVASIGPITSATAERLGVRVDVTASAYTTQGLLDALVAHSTSSKDA